MSEFVFSYRHPVGYAPSSDNASPWMAWFESMGGQIVDMGKPVIEHASIGTLGPDDSELGGYSIVRADDLESALALAKGCPILDRGGAVEVGRLGDVPELGHAGK